MNLLAVQRSGRSPVVDLGKFGQFVENNTVLVVGAACLLLVVVFVVRRKMERRTFRKPTRGAQEPSPQHGKVAAAVARYWLVDNVDPIVSSGPLVDRLRWLDGRRALLIVVLFSGLLLWKGAHIVGGVILGVTLLVVLARGMSVFRERQAVIADLFRVASTQMKYNRSDSPDDVIDVRSWSGRAIPTHVAVSVPAAFGSSDPARRSEFEVHWKEKTADSHSWKFEWDSAGRRVTAEAVDSLPTLVNHPGVDPSCPWNKIALGVTYGNGLAVWDPLDIPHMLVNGTTNSGKSVLQRNILLHCLSHPMWRVIGLDPKEVELTLLEGEPQALRYVTTLEQMTAALDEAVALMTQRKSQIRAHRAHHYFELEDHGPAVLVMIDEVYNLLAPAAGEGDSAKEINALKDRCNTRIGVLARTARFTAIYLVLAAQRGDADVLPGETKNNLDMRVAVGRMGQKASLMCLEDMSATRLPGVKGRCILKRAGDFTEFQGYFIESRSFASIAAQARNEFAAATAGPSPAGPADGQDTDQEPSPTPDGGAAAMGRQVGHVLRRLVSREERTSAVETAISVPDAGTGADAGPGTAVADAGTIHVDDLPDMVWDDNDIAGTPEDDRSARAVAAQAPGPAPTPRPAPRRPLRPR